MLHLIPAGSYEVLQDWALAQIEEDAAEAAAEGWGPNRSEW